MEESKEQEECGSDPRTSFRNVYSDNFRALPVDPDSDDFVYGDLVHLDDGELGIVTSKWESITPSPNEAGVYILVGKCYKIDPGTLTEKLGGSDDYGITM